MTRSTINEIRALADRYRRYGVTFEQLLTLAEKAPADLTERAVIVGLRMILANEYHESESFTLEDIAVTTGESVEEVKQRIKAMGIEVRYLQKMQPHLPS